MRAIAATLLGTLVSIGSLTAWFYMAPAYGSGWILFVAFLGSLTLLSSNGNLFLAALSSLSIAVASGAIWYLTRTLDNSGWVLALAVLAGLGTFGRFTAITSGLTTPTEKKDEPQT